MAGIGITKAMENFHSSLNMIYGLPVYDENKEVSNEDKDICTIFVQVLTVRSNTYDQVNFQYMIHANIFMHLQVPCMKTKGFLLDGMNVARSKNMTYGITSSIYENTNGNYISLEVWYDSQTFEDNCNNGEYITDSTDVKVAKVNVA